jgi:photosystem II stability/assembly factor-like uncharacterized protein
MAALRRFSVLILVGLGLGVPSAYAGAREAGPEAGIVFNSFIFRRPGEVLGNSGRGGIFTTNSRGERWQRSMRGMTNASGAEASIPGVCQALSSPGILYAATGDGLYRSDDFAADWVALAPLPSPALTACAVDPRDPDIVYALASGGDPNVLVKSTDGGRSFAVVGSGLPPLDQAFQMSVAPTDPATVYIQDFGTYQGLYVSHDGGVHFARLDTAPDYPFYVLPSPVADGTLFVVADAVYRSTDGGVTFEVVLANLPNDLSFDPLDSSILYAAGWTAGLFRSEDGGKTFAPFGRFPADQLGANGVSSVGVQLTNAGRIFYVNTARGNFRSDDGAETFVPIEHGYRGGQVSDLAFDTAGRLLVPLLNSAGMFRSTQAGRYEMAGATLPDDSVYQPAAVAASPEDPDVYLLATIGGTFRTSDGGASWTRSDPNLIFPSARAAFAPSDPRKVYVVGGFTGLLWSVDGGQSFDRTSFGRFGSLAVDPGNGDVVYIGDWVSNRGIFKSTDGGRTLQGTGLTAGNFSALVVDPLDSNVVYAGHRRGGVFRSTDGGVTFKEVSSGLVGAGVLALGIEPATHRLYVWMTNGGLFRSVDGAASWTAADTGEALRRSGRTTGRGAIAFDPAHPGHIFLGTRSVIEVHDER